MGVRARICGPVALPTSATSVAFGPANRLRINVSNPTGATIGFTLSVGGDQGSTRVYDNYPVRAGQVLVSRYMPSIADGEFLQAKASATGLVIAIDAQGAVADPPPSRILTVGNSTTAGDTNWPLIFQSLRPNDEVVNVSPLQPSVTTQLFIDNFNTLIVNNLSSTLRNVVLFFEGANWLDNNYGAFGAGWTDGALAWPKTAEFCAMVRALAGPKIYVSTLDWWNDGDQPLPGYHNAIDQYNAKCRERLTLDYDKLLDLYALGVLNPMDDPLSLYVDDGPHPINPPARIKIHKTDPAGWTVLANAFNNLYQAAG